MSTRLKPRATRNRTACSVCGGTGLDKVMDLPNLPLTGLFSEEAPIGKAPVYDQSLLVCRACGHGQLAERLSPADVYDRTYSFRTSHSATARAGTDFFLRFLDKVTGQRRFRCILDLGCNDLYLLGRLEGRATHRVGIDPIWAGREGDVPDKSLRIFGSTVENVDLGTLPEKPDLIVSRHTLEHIEDPVKVLEQLLSSAADDALLVFEVPGFDVLVRRLRFDHVFHQHLQYFNLSSFQSLIGRVGAGYREYDENYHDWGALVVAFTKAPSGSEKPVQRPFDAARIRRHYGMFQQQLKTTADLLGGFSGDTYGYGAAQMLPVLAYHLGTDLSFLKAVLDDDTEKQGLYYQNLPLKIESPSIVKHWEDVNVLLTAVDNSKPILTRVLQERRPKHLVHPFHIV